MITRRTNGRTASSKKPGTNNDQSFAKEAPGYATNVTLETIVAEFARAALADEDVARLHSGDLSIWSAMGEQIRELDRLGIPYTVTPGVPSFAAAAAALGR